MNLIHCLSTLLLLHSQLVGASIIDSDLSHGSTTTSTLSAQVTKSTTKANENDTDSLVSLEITCLFIGFVLCIALSAIWFCHRPKNIANTQPPNTGEELPLDRVNSLGRGSEDS